MKSASFAFIPSCSEILLRDKLQFDVLDSMEFSIAKPQIPHLLYKQGCEVCFVGSFFHSQKKLLTLMHSAFGQMT